MIAQHGAAGGVLGQIRMNDQSPVGTTGFDALTELSDGASEMAAAGRIISLEEYLHTSYLSPRLRFRRRRSPGASLGIETQSFAIENSPIAVDLSVIFAELS